MTTPDVSRFEMQPDRTEMLKGMKALRLVGTDRAASGLTVPTAGASESRPREHGSARVTRAER